jgi:hypothetical protein
VTLKQNLTAWMPQEEGKCIIEVGALSCVTSHGYAQTTDASRVCASENQLRH